MSIVVLRLVGKMVDIDAEFFLLPNSALYLTEDDILLVLARLPLP